MKVVITESQYRKLQKYVRKQELNEASFGRNIGMATLGAGLTFGSPDKGMAQSRNVEPSGEWTNRFGDEGDSANIKNNVLTITSPYALEVVMGYVFNQKNFNNVKIPVSVSYVGKDIDIQGLKDSISQMIIDTSKGGKNTKGTFYAPKGYSGEQELQNAPFLKLLSSLFRKQINIPIGKVIIKDEDIKVFIKNVMDGKTDFVIERGFLMLSKEY
jgi:hypothetical protein